MKISYKLSILVAIGMLLYGQAAFAFSIITDNNNSLNKKKTAPKITVINESVSGIDIEVILPVIYSHSVSVEGQDYQILDIPGGGHIDNLGFPFLPTISIYIEIPQDVSISIEELGCVSEVLEGYNVYPAQEHSLYPDRDKNKFAQNTAAYSTNKLFPLNKYTSAKPFVLRGHRLVMLVVYPVRFNPVTKQLAVSTNLKLHITYNKAADSFLKTRFKTLTYDAKTAGKNLDPVFKRFILNYKSLSAQTTLGTIRYKTQADGADYLIITPDDFYSHLIPFKQMKEAKGLAVKIVLTSQIGTNPSAEDITAYIKNAYETWSPAPMYLLLAGDTNLIPVHQGINQSPLHPEENMFTDLYYGTVDGDDYWPDIFVGRLPVRTVQELDVVINKIKEYETNFNPKDIWRNKILLAAFEESGRYFIDTSEQIRTFLQSAGYDCKLVYTGGNYEGTTEDILDYINEGVFIVNHRDHGMPEGWGEPKFRISDIPALTNKNKLPVMFSINCSSGRFDREEDCFGEALLKAQNNGENTGVAGFIGAIRDSYSGYNDELNKGMFTCIWPQFYDGYANAVGNSDKLGVVLNFAKFFMFDKYVVTDGAGYFPDQPEGKPTPDKTQYQFELFHLLGDPELSVRGDVSFSASINISSSSIVERGGDGDNRIDPGESFDLTVKLKSYNFDARGVSAVLKTDDEYVVIENNNVCFGNIPLGNTVVNENTPYRFTINKDCPKGHRIKFILSITAVDYKTERSFTSEVYQFWPVETEGLIYSSPAAADINGDGAVEILFGSADSKFYCIGKGDKKLWEFAADNDIRSSAAVDDLLEENEGLEIVFGSYDYKLYCFDKEGRKLWDFKAGERIHSSPIIADIVPEIKGKEIVFGSWDGWVYCLDRYGNKLWDYETKGGVQSSPVAADINTDGNLEIVIGSTDHKLYCLDKHGQKLWDYETMYAIHSSPAIADIDSGVDGLEIVFGSTDSGFYCLDKDGRKLWEFQTRGEGDLVADAELDANHDYQIESSKSDVRNDSKENLPDFTWDKDYGLHFKLMPDNSLLVKGKIMNIGTAAADNYEIRLAVSAWQLKLQGETQFYDQTLLRKDTIAPGESQIFSYRTETSKYGNPGIFPDFDTQFCEISLSLDREFKVEEINDFNNELSGSLRNGIDSSAAVADINGDENLEIVFGSDDRKLYCLDNKGGLLWVFETRSGIIAGAPSIADIFPDSAGLEMVFGAWFNSDHGSFFCLDSKGNELWRIDTTGGIYSSAAIIDLNPGAKDGLELLFGSYDKKMYCLDKNGRIFESDIEVTSSPNLKAWQMFRHDIRGTSTVDTPYFDKTPPQITPQTPTSIIRLKSIPKKYKIIFTADVIDSGSGLEKEKVVLYWSKKIIIKFWGGQWSYWSTPQTTPMFDQGHNSYKTTLYFSQAGNEIKYYIEAKDKSGNSKKTDTYTITR